jgi:hypothetical protein
MVAIHHHYLVTPAEDQQALTQFQQGWQTYRKLIDQNYLCHREVYATLHELLVTEFSFPFRFLDVACGDASASAGALLGTNIDH